MTRKRILVIDDEPAVRFGLRDFLETRGYEVCEAESCRQAQETFISTRPDIAILDYKLGDGDALSLLPRLREIDSSVPLVVLTAHGSIDIAVQAVKQGAEQFLIKPIELPALEVILQRLLQAGRNQRRQLAESTRAQRGVLDPFLGTSPAISDLAQQARKVLRADSPILILGETGTGKSVLAAWLHRNGPRADEAFVDLNCAGLSRDFLETELFGHEKGAFTGAVTNKSGLLEVAHGGTVFLDEIGDVDVQVQPKLLKVLEEKRFRRLGDIRDRHVDVHLIAATHQNLVEMVREHRFRSDLYFRINAIPLLIPPLRQRGGDTLVLARSMLTRLAAELGRGQLEFAPDAEKSLTSHSWPGNLRELRNVIERAILLGEANVISSHDLRFEAVQPAAPCDDTRLTLQQLERMHIERVLNDERGKVEQAARRLGIPRSSLYQKIKEYGIDLSKG